MQNFTNQSEEEANNISLLEMQAIFYWVLGGIGLFASFFLLIYGLIFGAILFNDFMQDIIGTLGFNIIDWIAGIYSTVFLLVLSLSILHIIQGFKLFYKKHRGFSIFVAIYSLLAFPLGTILGIFTLIVLNRPVVKELYFKEMEKRFGYSNSNNS